MIAHLRGRLITKHPGQAIVEAAGVGYDVTISVPTFSELPAVGSELALHIHTHVREDALALFGFLRIEEKQLFEKLITVSGIGPKLAITILSGMSTSEMVAAIRANDHARLTRIPGIGKKTAERIVRGAARQARRLRHGACDGHNFAGRRRCRLRPQQPGLSARPG
jgi:Holliday junction DNA helicase RuvA